MPDKPGAVPAIIRQLHMLKEQQAAQIERLQPVRAEIDAQGQTIQRRRQMLQPAGILKVILGQIQLLQVHQLVQKSRM